ncbi:MAG: CocE/NonD family hydrolase [Actinomycetota bacterium]|nr:CocE/NonD family hydrolase [Actinomycetota bacterium]
MSAVAAVVSLAATVVIAPEAAQAKTTVRNAGPPADYTATKNLSQPTYTEIVRTVHRVPAYDGEELYLEVVRPAAPGRYPVILEASPYHGTLADRDGTRILPEPRDAEGSIGLTGYFAPRGYAVVMMDLRGTGRSEGCLDHLGPKDARDLKQIVEWAASQDWSNGRVGMTGHSYVGSTPSVAAAQNPRGLKTIVPSAGLASMYDHQFQHGVPYFLQWAGPIEAYEQLALERKMPPLPPDPFGLGLVNTGDDFGNNVEDTGCGLPNSAAVAGEDQLSGRYADWHLLRDHDDGATNWGGPVFLVHGVNDNAARVSAMQWFTDRGGRAGDKLWLGQWDHGSGCCPTRRGIQWTYALHAWFDKHLAERNVHTGPPVEIFMSDGTFTGARTGDRTEVMTSTAWPGQPRMLSFHPNASDGSLAESTPGAHASTTFAGDPSLYLEENGQGGAAFRTNPLTDDLVLAGVPRLNLSAAVSVPRVHLIANLYDEAPDGNRRRITQCAMNPELRNGVATYTAVTPGERYDMAPPCFAMAHHLREGHRLVLRVSTADPDKVPLFAIDPEVRVFTGDDAATRVDIPVVDNPALYPDDVPLVENPPTGPAAAPIDRTITTASLGAPVRIEEVTSQFIEFTVPENSDTASGDVTATVSLPADIDLFLQRRLDDGSWSGDIVVGGSASLSGETMSIDRRLQAGKTYRIEVHNFAGPPGNAVHVQAVFRNSTGVPGA